MMEQRSLLFLLLIFWSGIFATGAFQTDFLVDSPIEDEWRVNVSLKGIFFGFLACIVFGCFVGGCLVSDAKNSDNHNQIFVDAGQRKVLSAKKRISFQFHNFPDTANNVERGAFIQSKISPRFLGNRFRVRLFPRGSNSSPTDDDYISVFLEPVLNVGIERLRVKFSIQAGRTFRSATHTFGRGRGENCIGWTDFAKLADVLDGTQNYLFDGTLTIKVDVQVYVATPEVWKPTSTNEHNKHRTYKIGEFADLVLKVGDERFCVHKSLLAKSATLFFDATEDANGLVIDYADRLAFKQMLRFIYYGELPLDLKDQAKALLDVADTFGCTNLKLFAEAKLAENISISNALEMYILADSKSCALLKEAASDFFVFESQDVLKTPGYALLKESPRLLAELLETQTYAPIHPNETGGFERMKVRALRRRLEDAGLDVDGSRETLVDRLNAAFN